MSLAYVQKMADTELILKGPIQRDFKILRRVPTYSFSGSIARHRFYIWSFYKNTAPQGLGMSFPPTLMFGFSLPVATH